jgi:hypothetical protein
MIRPSGGQPPANLLAAWGLAALKAYLVDSVLLISKRNFKHISPDHGIHLKKINKNKEKKENAKSKQTKHEEEKRAETEEEIQRKESAIKNLLEQIRDDVDPMDKNWGETETGLQSKSGSGMTEVVI